jgi:hypothetical protein
VPLPDPIEQAFTATRFLGFFTTARQRARKP